MRKIYWTSYRAGWRWKPKFKKDGEDWYSIWLFNRVYSFAVTPFGPDYTLAEWEKNNID